MDKRATSELTNISDSLGVLSLDGLKAFGENSTSSAISSSKSVNDRLNHERLKAFETLEKANKTIKSDVNKILQNNFMKTDYLRVPDSVSTSSITSKKDYLRVPDSVSTLSITSKKDYLRVPELPSSMLNRTEYVPYHRPDSINISDLVTDESINLDFKSTISTSHTKVSFDPSEITGRSTHCTERKSQQKLTNKNFAATSSRLSVGDILATSFAPKARDLGGVLGVGERSSVSTLGSLNSSNILLRTADMSLDNSETTFGKAAVGGGQFSFTTANCTGVTNSDEFQPAENMQSKLLMDEIAWAEEFATIPTSAMNKAPKDKVDNVKDFDLVSNPNSSVFGRDPNFSMGRFFNQRSEDLQNIVASLSPERLRAPIALVDDTQSTLSLNTPISNTKIVESTTDVDVTPQIDNRTYSKAPSAQQNSITNYDKQKGDKKHESKDSGNGTKEEEDSYLLSLSHIKKAFIKNIDKDIPSPDLIDLLKKPKKNKSPQNRQPSETTSSQYQYVPTKNQSSKQISTSASMRQSIEQYTNSLNTLEELLSENKENWDPQKMRGNESQADTMSFTESLLNNSDLKEQLQRSSIGQPRSPLSPLNMPTVRLTPNEFEDEQTDYQQEKSPKVTSTNRRHSPSPTSFRGQLNMASNDVKIPTNKSPTPHNQKTTNHKQTVGSTTSLSPTLPQSRQQKPLSSTRFDDQKSECDFVAISPNLTTKSLTSSSKGGGGNTIERTLMPNGSPYSRSSSISAGLQSPPISPAAPSSSSNGNAPRLCENCSPQMRGKAQTQKGGGGEGRGVQRMPSSPTASELSGNGVGVPKRTASVLSMRSGGGGVGAVVRSSSRCSSSSEFSHRDGNCMPLKVTAIELSWGSTRLRNAAHKTMQIKNTASKKLTLRVDVHGPGYQLVNMPSNNTVTLQSQECRTIAVSFCPTVIGAAIGKLSFYAPQNSSVAHNSAATACMSSFLDIPLYGYGGHCSVVAQEVHIAPVGMAFLQMGYLHELSQPIQRTLRIYNKGPLLGFALASIDSVGLRLPRLCSAFEIQPSAMLIPPGSSATLRVVFRPQREDVRKITRQTKSVLTLANLRLISGDEANRQRMRQLVARMSNEERANVSSSKSLEALWAKLPGEKLIEELQMFKESPSLTFDLLTHMRIHEVALTINDDYLDETIKSTSSFYFADEDETVLFRTVCSPSPTPNNCVDGMGQVLDRVDELTEVDEEDGSATSTSSRGDACCWSVMPNTLNFHVSGGCEERRKLCTSLFICNSFKSRQYFEVSTNRKKLLQLTPSEGYVEPDGGHLEVKVYLLCDKLSTDNRREEALYVTVSMENERITVPVRLCDAAEEQKVRE